MSDSFNEVQAAVAPDMAKGQLLGSLAYRLSPEQEAAQRAAQQQIEAQYRDREERERADVQGRLDRDTRQAAVHAALMIEGERATAEQVLANAAKFAAFLIG